MKWLIWYPAAFQRLVWVSKELLRAGLIGNAAFSTNLDQGWPLPLCFNSGTAPILTAMHASIWFLRGRFLIPFDFFESHHLYLFEERSESRESLQNSQPIPQGALAFLKWAGGCVPDTLIKLHIMNCQKELTEYIMPALSLTFHNCLWLFYYSRKL